MLDFLKKKLSKALAGAPKPLKSEDVLAALSVPQLEDMMDMLRRVLYEIEIWDDLESKLRANKKTEMVDETVMLLIGEKNRLKKSIEDMMKYIKVDAKLIAYNIEKQLQLLQKIEALRAAVIKISKSI